MKTLNPELAAEFALILSALLCNPVEPAAGAKAIVEIHPSLGATHSMEVVRARHS